MTVKKAEAFRRNIVKALSDRIAVNSSKGFIFYKEYVRIYRYFIPQIIPQI